VDLASLQDAQSQDGDLKFVRDWLVDAREPSEAELFVSSPAAKSYWLNKEQLVLIEGVLYEDDGMSGEKRLILPASLREQAMKLNHELPSSGHQGVKRTKERVKEKYAWYGLGKDVSNFVAGCGVCNRSKKVDRHGKCPMTEYHAGAPMERVHLDFLGPLPRTPRGNEYILMMVDQFTKWVECIPLPTQTAEETAKAAVDNFFSRFGMPFQIFTDQGRNFESKLFTELCRVLEIHKARTTPYRPSANGQVERYNRTLMDAVRCFIGKSQDQWDLYLQQIAGALRSSVNRNTGFTANKLMLGREVTTPAQLMFPQAGKSYQNVEGYVASLADRMQKAHEVARGKLNTASKQMKRQYDLRILERPYQVGDVVYILDTAVLKGTCKKLSPPWKGPGIIVAKLSAYLFRVKLRNSVFVTNHDRLKPSHDRTVPRWIEHWKANPALSQGASAQDDKLYCFCRQPWQGRFMIQCDHCNEWYHGACVNVTPTEALDIAVYQCDECFELSRRNN
jgi:transposase InsO family protein